MSVLMRVARMTLFTGVLLLLLGGGAFGLVVYTMLGVNVFGLVAIGVALVGAFFLALGVVLWLVAIIRR